MVSVSDWACGWHRSGGYGYGTASGAGTGIGRVTYAGGAGFGDGCGAGGHCGSGWGSTLRGVERESVGGGCQRGIGTRFCYGRSEEW